MKTTVYSLCMRASLIERIRSELKLKPETADSREPKHWPDLPSVSGKPRHSKREQLAEIREMATTHEDLLNKRLTFLVAFAGFAIAGVVAARENLWIGTSILSVAGIVSCWLVMSIKRCYYKTCFLFAVLVRNGDPFTRMMSDTFSSSKDPEFEIGSESVSIIGWLLPIWIRNVLFLGAGLLCALGIFGVSLVPIAKSNECELNFKVIRNLDSIYSKVDVLRTKLGNVGTKFDKLALSRTTSSR